MNEVSVQRRLTTQFIKRRPLMVELRTVTQQRTPDGGSRRTVGDPRPAQMMTLVEPSSSGYGATQTSVNGVRTPIDYMLLGEWDADVRELDQFQDDKGHSYQVVTVLPDNDFEVRAYVMRMR